MTPQFEVEAEADLIYHSLLKSLDSTIGKTNASYVVKFLESEGAIQNGHLDIGKLDDALREAFANVSFSVLSRETVRKKQAI